MQYKEVLPEQCPPNDAHPLNDCVVIRMVSSSEPDDRDFESHAAKGKPIPVSSRSGKAPPDACSWASCSTYLAGDKPVAQAKALALLPWFKKFNYAAFVSVNEDAGAARVNPESRHVDFWFFHGFEPCKSILSVEAVR